MIADLRGLKVLELATGIAGPYAGRLLAMLGATVVKVEPPDGDPARRLALDDRPLIEPSPVFVHLNIGKELRPAGDDVLPLADWADVVLDSAVRSQRAGTALDPELLRASGSVVASVTAWGYGAEAAGTAQDELLVQAASGILSATLDDGRPHRFPGWQSQYLAGGFAVTAVLTALAEGGGHHVDVSWVASIVTGVEAGMCAFLNGADEPLRPPGEGRDRQGGFQVGAFPAGVFRCRDGHVIPGTVRGVDWELQCEVYGRRDLLEDERFDARHRFTNRDELRAELQPWYDAHGKYEIFEAALDVGWACGIVMTAGDALSDPHLAAREYLGSATFEGRPVVAPRQPWRVSAGSSDRGHPVEPVGAASVPAPPRLSELKVLELTWAWAGPFVGRYLGAFGADVVRVETGRYPDGWRTRLKWKHAGVPIPEGEDPDGFTWDAAALHNSLNRNKRSLSLDLTHREGRSLFLALLDQADLLVLNMSYRMLADRGIEDEVMAAVDRGLVVLNMPALGATGPYRDMPGYGILMEGMGGFATRYGSRDEPARSTNTYYPDLVAGLHGTAAALSALAGRRSSGEGRLIDLSQQEVTWLQFAEALVLRSTEDREPDRLGDAEPGCVPSGYYPSSDARWIALVVQDDEQFRALVAAAAPHLDDLASLGREERCRRRDELDERLRSWTSSVTALAIEETLLRAGLPVQRGRTYRQVYTDGSLDERGILERLEHPVTGDRPYIGVPAVIDGVPWRSRRAAPRFGEHTDEVLEQWLGTGEPDRRRLRDEGVIGTTPTVPPRR